MIEAYISNIRTTCERYQHYFFHYVSKHANGTGHYSKIEGLKRNEETYLTGAVPSYAQKVVEADRQQLCS